MLSTIYTSMSGLQSFSKGLDVISGNVANVNTAGYKGTELLFQDVFYGYDPKGERNGDAYGSWIGRGVAAEITSLRFSQGDFRDTDNATDAAIDGQGFFIVSHDGEYLYTRDGQFEFDDNGVLVTRTGRETVMGLDESGALAPITLDKLKAQPAKPTSEIRFVNNLSLGATQHVVNNVKVINSLGETVLLSITFRNTSTTTPRSWQIEVKDAQNKVVAPLGELRFRGNGSPETDYNTFKFTYTSANGDPQDITLHFGEPGSFSGATSFSGGATSDLAVNRQDGFAQGTLLSTTFDDQGRLVARYTNEQSVTGAHLALATFNDLQALRRLDGGRFHAAPNQTATIGKAGTGTLGRIVAGRVELSNVELSQQFTDMIVVQRGYQASSQVLTAANEMIQQLLETSKR
jgi:flagellar hook protein FlgE